MTRLQTHFAPAERATDEEVQFDAQELAKGQELAHVIPSIVMVLNEQRQVVFKSQHLMDFLDHSSDEDVIGKRPGEAFGCIHASECQGGCGTTEFCSECGAVKSILQSQIYGTKVQNECRITTKEGKAFDLRVWAMPYEHHQKTFTLFCMEDIQKEKRCEQLEKSYFHDLNQLVGTLFGISQQFRSNDGQETEEQCASSIEKASQLLLDQIRSHQTFNAAERGDLNVSTQIFDSLDLLKEISESTIEENMGCTDIIEICPQADSLDLESDKSLLVRILHHMVKNALETDLNGEPVKLSCRQDGNRCTFSVHNNGHIPRNIQLQLYQRSFTTKGSGRGIGTYSMKLFGERVLGGKVWHESSESSGTTFYVSLPLAPHNGASDVSYIENESESFAGALIER